MRRWRVFRGCGGGLGRNWVWERDIVSLVREGGEGGEGEGKW
jgi:hypothetical protein